MNNRENNFKVTQNYRKMMDKLLAKMKAGTLVFIDENEFKRRVVRKNPANC